MFHTAWEWDYTNPCLPRSQAMSHTAWEWDYTNPCLPRSQAMFHTAWEWDYTNPCLPLGDLTIDTRSNMTLPRGTFDLSSKNNRISTNIKKWQKLAPVITHTTQSNLQGMLVLESDPHNIEDGGLVNRLQVKVYTAPNAGTLLCTNAVFLHSHILSCSKSYKHYSRRIQCFCKCLAQ